MFLSKKWILSIIAVTGLAFLILLIIQYGWIRKSVEINRRHFADRMLIVSNKVRRAFLCDTALLATYSPADNSPQFVYKDRSDSVSFKNRVRKKLDSVLRAEEMPLSASITVLTGNICYLMNVIPPESHHAQLDQALYKLCLCSHSDPGALDMGFDLMPNKSLVSDSSGLILPSVILILFLIALFAYIIFVINRQKRLGDLKNDFINNLTHEFNTPLFSIGLTSNLLSKSEAIHQSEKLMSYVSLINTEKTRLQTQVDKILRLTAVESGSLLLEKERVDMNELIKQTIAGFSLLVPEKGKISFVPAATNYFVQGDRLHLSNAIGNLLDNAIKYSDKPPEILLTTADAEGRFELTIKDNGIGMSKAELSMIFKKYFRVKHGDRHDVKGFGLGLSYVKKIVELHNGSIDVKSKPGEGSVFMIHLPHA